MCPCGEREGETKNEGEILDECWLVNGAFRCSFPGRIVLEMTEYIRRSDGCFLTVVPPSLLARWVKQKFPWEIDGM